MPILKQIDFEIRIPQSSINPAYAALEYMLGWYNADGGWYLWLFTDHTHRERIEGEVINARTEPSKVFSGSSRFIDLVAEDLTYNEYETISHITKSKNIWHLYRTDSGIPPAKVAIITDAIVERESDNRYNLKLTVQEKSPIIIK